MMSGIFYSVVYCAPESSGVSYSLLAANPDRSDRLDVSLLLRPNNLQSLGRSLKISNDRDLCARNQPHERPEPYSRFLSAEGCGFDQLALLLGRQLSHQPPQKLLCINDVPLANVGLGGILFKPQIRRFEHQLPLIRL